VNLIIPEPQYAKSLPREPGIPNPVRLRFVMLAAVGLNDEARIVANEIRDVWPDRNLTPEFRSSELPIAKDAPQRMLGIGHGVAQFLGTAE